MVTPAVPFLDVVADVSRGNKKILQSEILDAGPLAVVDQGASDIAGYTHDLSATVRLPPPLIVFGDHTRAFKYVDFPFAMGADGVKVLQVREGFDPKFVYHSLASAQIPSAGYSRHFKFLKKISIPRPPIEEQRRIAAILDQADRIRFKRRLLESFLSDLPVARFIETFGAGRVPLAPLGALCSTHSGSTPPKGLDGAWSGGTPWFSPKDFKAPELRDSADHLDLAALGNRTPKVLPEGTVCIVVRGMILAHTVPVSLLRPAATINQDVKALLPGPGIRPRYLLWALRSQVDRILSEVSTAAHGTKKLEARSLNSIAIPLAPLAEQDEFCDWLDRLSCVQEESRVARQREDELFASLQSRAFRGEL